MDIKIIVATHKEYRMPFGVMYLPVHVGAAGNNDIGYQRDDDGESISKKNANYCELTGLYWAWKHVDADYIGLVHYRRHFSSEKHGGDKWDRVISVDQVETWLKHAPVLLPTPRNYRVETSYSQYVHAHHAIDLDTTRQILEESYPSYLGAWERCMNSKVGHRFNMFIMQRDILNEYCSWLFDVLFELEKRLDISSYSPNDARVFGFVAERLLDVWLMTNGVSYVDIPYVYMESQNWLVKGGRFLLRKIGIKRS